MRVGPLLAGVGAGAVWFLLFGADRRDLRGYAWWTVIAGGRGLGRRGGAGAARRPRRGGRRRGGGAGSAGASRRSRGGPLEHHQRLAPVVRIVRHLQAVRDRSSRRSVADRMRYALGLDEAAGLGRRSAHGLDSRSGSTPIAAVAG